LNSADNITIVLKGLEGVVTERIVQLGANNGNLFAVGTNTTLILPAIRPPPAAACK